MHIKVAGSGPDLVLLHGWGMCADVWDEIAAQLALQFRVHCVDLPGYGESPGCTPYTLDALASMLAMACAPHAIVCGWSLGGQLALHWALMKPGQVERLVLVASTPRFVRAPGWESGMQPEILDAYAQDLAREPDDTLQRFASLQARGDTDARKVSRRLRECVATHCEGDIEALAAGLQILKDTDLRTDLPDITQPVLILHGERDSVVPLAAGEYLQRSLRRATLEVIDGAGHAPFIGRAHGVARRIAEFGNG